ncbi:MAG: UDP-N-acetylmuramate dehydrogenase [Cellvibrio sp.]|nr:UDP-N-acetylmuramate dehydrogenase [Cellvibrio sp.]
MPLFLPKFSLQKLNTLAVPATADFYVSVTNHNEIKEALAFARERELPIFLLGGGSNIVFENNFQGLVIHLKLQGVQVVQETDDHVWVNFAAGENWHQTVEYCLDNGYYGLENLSLIPGSVGAAPIQNIGAYGVEVKDLITELSTIEIASGTEVYFLNESCQFAYRDSIFKQAFKDKYIITSVTFKLSKIAKTNLTYPALQEYFSGEDLAAVTPEEVSQAVINIRQSKLPDPEQIPNVGSFFKNPVIDQSHFEKLMKQYPKMPSYPAGDNHRKLPAAWLIDQAGWKGKEFNGVAVHSQQALVLTNPNKLIGRVILDLANAIQKSVKDQFAIDLEIEPRVY